MSEPTDTAYLDTDFTTFHALIRDAVVAAILWGPNSPQHRAALAKVAETYDKPLTQPPQKA